MIKFNVLIHDSNTDKIKPYNIINQSLIENVKRERRKKNIYDMNSLKEYLSRDFHYHYWCKSECEIIMHGLFSKSEEHKIDIWTQIEMNLDLITRLVCEECKFKFNK